MKKIPTMFAGWEPVEQSGFAKLHGYGTHRLIRHAEAKRRSDAPASSASLPARAILEQRV